MNQEHDIQFQDHFQVKKGNFYQQNIELGIQGNNYNPQGHFVKIPPSETGYGVLYEEESKDDSYPTTIDPRMHRGYVNNTAVIQQGVVYQPVPQGGMYNYPQTYSNVQFQSTYNSVPYQGSDRIFVNPHETQGTSSRDHTFLIETKIKNDFCFYTYLLRFSIGWALGSLMLSDAAGMQIELLIFNGISQAIYVLGYCLALSSKTKLDSEKQFYAFVIFCFMTTVSLLNTIYNFPIIMQRLMVKFSNNDSKEHAQYFDNLEELMNVLQVLIILLFIILPFVWNLFLVHSSSILHRLIKERNRLANGAKPVSMVA